MSFHLTSSAFDDPKIAVLLKKLADYFGEQDIPFFVVGAIARDMVLGMIHQRKTGRKTNDLDIAIMLRDWAAFDEVSEDLGAWPGFIKCPKQKQRWYYEERLTLDIIPFGEIAAADDHIYWPPDETPAMGIRGFTVMAEHALQVTLDNTVQLPVASLPGLFLLKLAAWKDRHHENDKDAQDMGSILTDYLELNYDRAAAAHLDIYQRDAFTVFTAGAQLMGKDLRFMLQGNPTLRAQMGGILEGEIVKKEHGVLVYQIVRSQGIRYEEVFAALELLAGELG